MTGCVHEANSSCPFAWTEEAAVAQNYGCLPEPRDIIIMRQAHGKTWACHSDPTVPCLGAIQFQKEEGLEYKVIDTDLLTERSDWSKYCEE